MPAVLRTHTSDQNGLRAVIGERIRRARSNQRVSLRDLAARVGVSPSTLSAIENGRTSVSAVRLTQLAAAMDVPVETLLSDDESDGHLTQNASGSEPARRRRDWRVFEPAPFDAPIQAALEAFLEVGYHGATMRDIARRAGLSVPGMYHHYESKQEMLITILDSSMDELIWRLESAVAEADDVRSRLANAVECLVLFRTRRRDWAFLGRTEQRSLEPAPAARAHDKRIASEHALIEIIEEGRNAGIFTTGSARVSGRAVIHMCVGTVYWFREDGKDSAETIARQYVDLALRMVEYAGPRGSS